MRRVLRGLERMLSLERALGIRRSAFRNDFGSAVFSCHRARVLQRPGVVHCSNQLDFGTLGGVES